MVKYLSYTVLTLLTIFIAGCGYDTAIQYKLNASSNYKLRITTDNPSKASAVIKQAFKDEGMEFTYHVNFGAVESYALFESGGNTTVTLHYDKAFKTAAVGIYPARLNSFSKKRRKQLKEREQALVRIKAKLEATDSFDEYVLTGWQLNYPNQRPKLPDPVDE